MRGAAYIGILDVSLLFFVVVFFFLSISSGYVNWIGMDMHAYPNL